MESELLEHVESEALSKLACSNKSRSHNRHGTGHLDGYRPALSSLALGIPLPSSLPELQSVVHSGGGDSLGRQAFP